MSALFALLKYYDFLKINYQMQSSQGDGFPVTDLYTIEDHDKTIIIVSVLGLLGVNSPLPSYLLDNQNICWNNFVNLLNHRFYQLFYLLWKQYHPIHEENQKDGYKKIITGLVKNEWPASFSFARYLFRKNCRTRDLALMIKTLIPESKIIIKQNVPVWRPVKLTSEYCQLGDNAILGTESIDVASRIEVTIIIKDIALAKDLILGQSNYQMLYYFMNIFAECYFSLELFLYALVNQENPPRLGENTIYLNGLDAMGIVNHQWHTCFLPPLPGCL